MICYLCENEILDPEEANDDHVPPSGFFLTENPPGIIKLKTHKGCNSGFTFDEQYAISIVRNTSNWNPTAELIWHKRGFKSLTKPKRRNLLKKIVGDTVLVNGYYKTNIDEKGENRLLKVMEKIARGLYFSEFNKTIKSEKFELNRNEFIYKQNINSWNIGPDFISIGNSGKEEFKYLRRYIANNLEYYLFFYNVYLFRLLYERHSTTVL